MLEANTDPDPNPDPDPVRIQGFNNQKLKKNYSWKFFFIFFWSKTAIYLALSLHKVCPSYRRNLQFSKEAIQHFKTWILQIIVYFCGSFLPSWIRIRIPNTDPDPDPQTQLNTDPIRIRIPDPDPQHCTELSSSKGIPSVPNWESNQDHKHKLQANLQRKISVLRIRIRDTVPFWPLDPGSGINIPNPQHGKFLILF